MKKTRTVHVDIKCEAWLRTTVQTTMTDKEIQELANDCDEAMEFFNECLGADGNWDISPELSEQPLHILNEFSYGRASWDPKDPSTYVWIEEVPDVPANLKKSKQKIIKKITRIQKKIIKDHLMIEGSENFDFYPCEDGLSVSMVNKYDGEETTIRKRNPEELKPDSNGILINN